MTLPKISVVLISYNREDVLPQAVDSVLAQDERDFELIIVDDCSLDGTQSYLKSLRDPRIRLLKPPHNLGSPGARNFGLEAARADFVAFLDSDDVYGAGRLSAPLAAFAREPEVVVTLSSAVKRNFKDSHVAHMPELTLASTAFEWAMMSDLIGVDTSGITVRRQVALDAGGFCRRIVCLEDREFMIRVSRRGSGHLIAAPLWEKNWSVDGQSNQWHRAGVALLTYVAEHPEFLDRFRKMGSYLATKVLVSDLRHGMLGPLFRDLRDFARVGLIDANLVRLWRDHRQVRRYRRAASKPEQLAALSGPPAQWR